MLAATVLFSSMQGLVKYLDHLSHFQLIFARSIFSFVVCLITIAKLKISPFGNDKVGLFMRGLTGAISLTCFFYALHHMPLGSVSVIVNIKPFLILGVAYLLIGEKTKLTSILFFCISFIGIVVLKGFDDRVSYISLAATLGAAFFAAFSHTLIRKLRTTEKPIIIIFYFTLVTIPIILPLMIYDWVEPTLEDWGIMLLIGIITHFAQLCLTYAYKYESVGNISNLYYLGIVFAFGIGYFFFDEGYTAESFIGIGIILLGIILNIAYMQQKKS